MSNPQVSLTPVRGKRSRLWTFIDRDDETKNTHLWLVNNATRAIHKQLGKRDARARALFEFIAPDGPKESVTATQIRQALVDADEKPDYNFGWWVAHFYSPVTGGNFFPPFSRDTARTMAERFYWSSLEAKARGDATRAAYQLGLALHFFGDATQPMHAANYTNALLPFMAHEAFEVAAITWQTDVNQPSWSGPRNRTLDPGLHVHHAAEDAAPLFLELVPLLVRLEASLGPFPVDTKKALEIFRPVKPTVIQALTKGISNMADFLWLWTCQAAAMAKWGQAGDTPAVARTPDGRSQPAVVRVDKSGNGTWYIRKAIDDGTPIEVPIPGSGRGNRIFVSGNFAAAGEGVRLAVCDVRTGDWTFFDDRGSVVREVRLPTGIPVAAPFTRVEEDQIATVINGQWTIHDLRDGATTTLQFGEATDFPIPGQYFGRGHLAVPAVWRPANSTWYARQGEGWVELQWGEPGDAPVANFFDASGTAVPAVYRFKTRTWHISARFSGKGERREIAWGGDGDHALAGAYFGNGVSRPAVWRPSSGLWIVAPDLEPHAS